MHSQRILNPLLTPIETQYSVKDFDKTNHGQMVIWLILVVVSLYYSS